ncbi:MAG TPA: DUF2939 domain-containing protein [Leptolyngbyaceae cyanobacterium M33_DOE_097]|uniref:DUF2939 domain-containing protein n=1 Tax=Oscillatoriales cyanobacterium SpSt-418 TaxID=2282169 RepID=A0A7C3PHD3_9CYAN|nr:DUF2939 domain-containing protein [Leptolyngbyaceae cyanobacterium M33_DOE_097]
MHTLKTRFLSNKRNLAILITSIAGVFGIAFYFSPHLTVYQMQQAVSRKDARSLSERIDFSAVRSSLKAWVKAQLLQQAGKQSQSPYAAPGLAMLAGQYVNFMIDTIVTPEGLEEIMRSSKSTTSQAGLSQADLEKALSDVQMNYESFNSFVVLTVVSTPTNMANSNGQTTNKVELVFRRDGLSWKLAGIRIPSNL